MRIVYVTDDFSAANSGVTSALRELSSRMAARGFEVFVVAPSGNNVSVADGVQVVSCTTSPVGRPWRYSKALSQTVTALARRKAVVHIHGVWAAPTLQGLRAARSARAPSILTPHNMLGGWLFHRSFRKRVKKTAYWHLFAPIFRQVSVVQALTSQEALQLAPFFPEEVIEVVPNGIDLTVLPSPEPRGRSTGSSYIGYLGRLFPGKGLEVLFRAYALAVSGGSQLPPLVVAGTATNPAYRAELQQLIARLHISDRIRFIGHVIGELKWRFYRDAQAIVLPSFSEGLSMVALEALACAAPLLTTPAAGMPDIQSAGGLLAEPRVEPWSRLLIEASRWSNDERDRRGVLARRHVETYYAWSKVSAQYEQLYRRLLPL